MNKSKIKHVTMIPLPKIDIENDENDRSITIKLNGNIVASSNYDSIGWSGMEALSDMATSIESQLEELAKKFAAKEAINKDNQRSSKAPR